MGKERFLVTHTEEGLWSVSHNDMLLAVHSTEAEALSYTFTMASRARRSGCATAVVITRTDRGTERGIDFLVSEDNGTVCIRPACHRADIPQAVLHKAGPGATVVSLNQARTLFDARRSKALVPSGSAP